MNTTVDLFASGLGLALFSPEVVKNLDFGDEVKGFLEEQKMVLIATGSPQLDYTIQVIIDKPPASVMESTVLVSAKFGIHITDNQLIIADGYAVEHDFSNDYEIQELTIPDGYYLATAVYDPSRAGPHSRMHIDIYFDRVNEKVDNPSMVDLFFIAK
jgi:hypothetical protein